MKRLTLSLSLRKAAKKHILKRRLNAQSAMEYLMTYGWAILIIAVVLAVLFSLGITNPMFFAPKAQPGSCQVLRPYGVGTSADVNLGGVCNNEMPNFVAQFNGGTYASVGELQQEGGTNRISYSVWFKKISQSGSWPMVFGDTGGSTRNGYDLYVGGPGSTETNHLAAERFSNVPPTGIFSTGTLTTGTWYFAVITYGSGTFSLYLNGVFQSSGSTAGTIRVNDIMTLGSESGVYNWGNYQVANFQFYNTTLDASSIDALYNEGIGGAPIDLQHLVGWWPLNGNANDYSGNNNQGTATNVRYIGTWTNGYVQP